jgi:hypothetical protein
MARVQDSGAAFSSSTAARQSVLAIAESMCRLALLTGAD